MSSPLPPSLFPAPPRPVFPAGQSSTAEVLLRYEDIAQDGRLIPVALPTAMSALWQNVLRSHPGQRAAIASGVLPILTRLTLTSLEAPIRVDVPVETRAGFLLTHDRDPDGEARIFMNVWAELHGAAGRIGTRPPGPPVLAGHLFAEHTFTRLFAPPGRRRVSRLEAEGYPAIPEARYEAPVPTSAGEPPAGASWLDALAPDPAEVAFTLDQTDSNQHVNSLVYIRIFLDAVQRRLAAGARPLAVLSRAVDIAYRKPCFAGDRVRAHVRLFEADGALGAAGVIAGPGEEERPRCYIRVLLGA
ncbi:MAG TPA: hypothetical protein VNO30_28005 [Kofleriaceae bacterium]|nr:hypothetical protein [Kofleriaceae bacterium]